MKYFVISAIALTSCLMLASAAPVLSSDNNLFSRDLTDQELLARDFEALFARSNMASKAASAAGKVTKKALNTFVPSLFARGNTASKAASAAGKAAGKAAEKTLTNPQGAMDRDQRKKNRDAALNMATGKGTPARPPPFLQNNQAQTTTKQPPKVQGKISAFQPVKKLKRALIEDDLD